MHVAIRKKHPAVVLTNIYKEQTFSSRKAGVAIVCEQLGFIQSCLGLCGLSRGSAFLPDALDAFKLYIKAYQRKMNNLSQHLNLVVDAEIRKTHQRYSILLFFIQ